VILLLIVVIVVVLVVVDVIVEVVVLLPLRAVSDKVGGVTTFEIALRVSSISSPLLSKVVHHTNFPYKQGNLIIGNALVLLIGSCSERRQTKIQRK
jgi:hypothetical protein